MQKEKNHNTINYAMIGASGRMGMSILNCSLENKTIELHSSLENSSSHPTKKDTNENHELKACALIGKRVLLILIENGIY